MGEPELSQMRGVLLKSWADVRSWCDMQFERQSALYRGHSQCFQRLLPAIDRFERRTAVSKFSVFASEFTDLRRFARLAAPHLERWEADWIKNPILTMALLQHYGGPTRLLDWTRSPWVAIYFACRSNPELSGEILYFRPHALGNRVAPGLREFHGSIVRLSESDDWEPQAFRETLEVAAGNPPLVCSVSADLMSPFPRAAAQQSAFTVSNQVGFDHWEGLQRQIHEYTSKTPHDESGRVVIDARAKPEIMDRLRSLQHTAEQLFPGLEGLAMHVADLALRDDGPFRRDPHDSGLDASG
ncbi:MAG: FRG domain-containing protein [Planctomycetota bacterium]